MLESIRNTIKIMKETANTIVFILIILFKRTGNTIWIVLLIVLPVQNEIKTKYIYII